MQRSERIGRGTSNLHLGVSIFFITPVLSPLPPDTGAPSSETENHLTKQDAEGSHSYTVCERSVPISLAHETIQPGTATPPSRLTNSNRWQLSLIPDNHLIGMHGLGCAPEDGVIFRN